MRLGQPDVQRHEARLGAEAEQREQERDRWPRPAAACMRAHGVEACSRRVPPCSTPKHSRIAIAPTCAISR